MRGNRSYPVFCGGTRKTNERQSGQGESLLQAGRGSTRIEDKGISKIASATAGEVEGVLMIAKATRTAGERVSRSAARYTPRLNFVSRRCCVEARKFAAHPERRTYSGKKKERQDVPLLKQTFAPTRAVKTSGSR